MTTKEQTPQLKLQCDQCCFSHEELPINPYIHPNDRRLECRRFPPNILVSGYGEDDVWDDELNFSYPTVLAEFWCGEFKPLDEAAIERQKKRAEEFNKRVEEEYG